MSLEQRQAEALESIDLSLGEILVHVAKMASAAERIAARYGAPIVALGVGARLNKCAKGHRMQMTDEHCPTCYLEEHPEKAPQPRRPPPAGPSAA